MAKRVKKDYFTQFYSPGSEMSSGEDWLFLDLVAFSTNSECIHCKVSCEQAVVDVFFWKPPELRKQWLMCLPASLEFFVARSEWRRRMSPFGEWSGTWGASRSGVGGGFSIHFFLHFFYIFSVSLHSLCWRRERWEPASCRHFRSQKGRDAFWPICGVVSAGQKMKGKMEDQRPQFGIRLSDHLVYNTSSPSVAGLTLASEYLN